MYITSLHESMSVWHYQFTQPSFPRDILALYRMFASNVHKFEICPLFFRHLGLKILNIKILNVKVQESSILICSLNLMQQTEYHVLGNYPDELDNCLLGNSDRAMTFTMTHEMSSRLLHATFMCL